MWFKFIGWVFVDWVGCCVEVLIDFGFDVNMMGFQCEVFVYWLDGMLIKSINLCNQWVLIVEVVVGDEFVEFYLEGVFNFVFFDYYFFLLMQEGDIFIFLKELLYWLWCFDFVVFEFEVFDLFFDFEVLFELQVEFFVMLLCCMCILQVMDDVFDVFDLQYIVEIVGDVRVWFVDVFVVLVEVSVYCILVVGYVYIDFVWLWLVCEMICKVVCMILFMIMFIEEQFDFQYGMFSVQQYVWIKEYCFEVWEWVKVVVVVGCFLFLGGMWVEFDIVMLMGELFVWQFLYGQWFFECEFGICLKGVWLLDSFGYLLVFLQFMCCVGFEWFFMQKILWNQQNVFLYYFFFWEGIDGLQVFMYFLLMDIYNLQFSGMEVVKVLCQFKENCFSLWLIVLVGWGDGGGGMMCEMMGKVEWLCDFEGSVQVVWEYFDVFFDVVKVELLNLVVWVGEFYFELYCGMFISQYVMKVFYCWVEYVLVEVELWVVIDVVCIGVVYLQVEFDWFWQVVLLYEFYDILFGMLIVWVYCEVVVVLFDVLLDVCDIVDVVCWLFVGEGDCELWFELILVGWG